MAALEVKNEAALARSMGLTPQALSGFKKKGFFPASTLVKFASRYKLSLDYLLADEIPRQGTEALHLQPDFPADDFVLIRQVNGKISAGKASCQMIRLMSRQHSVRIGSNARVASPTTCL